MIIETCTNVARPAPRTRVTTIVSLVLFIAALGSVMTIASTAAAERRMSATYQTTNEATIDAPTIEVTSALDMRDDEYNSDYIFGMTRGVADSTIIPAVKPLFFLVTIPLDIVFLPFAAIGGVF